MSVVRRARSSNGWMGGKWTARAVMLAVCLPVAASAVQRGSPRASDVQLRVGFAQPGGGYRIETLTLETYVARVLAGEAARDSPPAALEALAITIRTFALANRDRHRADGFDLCDETHCQVLRAASLATERAADSTAGQVLMRNGAVAQVFYSASCGGRTEIPSDVWPGAEDPPYLPSEDDEACNGSPAWDTELTIDELSRAFRAAGFRGDRLRFVRVVSRNQSGRVAQLALDGLSPATISGQELRVAVGRTLGWQHIKSTAFELQQTGRGYRFSGHGSGHGVGLCVIGSVNLASRGTSASAILTKYFPGLVIGSAGPRLVPEPPTRVAAPPPAVVTRSRSGLLLSLPDEDEGQRGAILEMAGRARDTLAQALGVTPPDTVTLRFHPTTDDYERATGQPWFTAGVVADREGKAELHFLPLAVLRERGVLERTLRSELVHVMTDAELSKRPRWVSDGAAMYFSAGTAVSAGRGDSDRSSGRLVCPTDNELLRPVSVGAFSNALARARACFARQIAAGRAWRDVR